MFNRIGNRKVWASETCKARIHLPCDKKTFRLIDADGNSLSDRRFRTFKAAEAAAKEF